MHKAISGVRPVLFYLGQFVALSLATGIAEGQVPETPEMHLPGLIYAEAVVRDFATNRSRQSIIAIEPSSGKWKELIVDGRGPRVSPDGRSIAFSKVALKFRTGGQPSLEGELWICAADNPGAGRLVAKNYVRPVWSADGRFVLGSVSEPKGQNAAAAKFSTYRFPIDGGAKNRWSAAGNDQLLDVSRDGRQFVVQSHVKKPYQLEVMNSDGSNAHRITKFKGGHAQFSPDGRQIAYLCMDDPQQEGRSINVVDASGENDHLVYLQQGKEPIDPSWSPDGKWLAIAVAGLKRNPDGRWSLDLERSVLVIVDADGNRKRVLKLAETDLKADSFGCIHWH